MEKNQIHKKYSYLKLPETTLSCSSNTEKIVEDSEEKLFPSTKIHLRNKEDTIFDDEKNNVESHDRTKDHSREFLVQLGIIYVASLLMFIAGMHTGWVGPTILKLSSNNSEIPMTSTEISWLAAMVPFGGGIGPIFGAILANKIGRKTTILLSTIPEIFTWIAIILAKNAYCLCIVQFIRGVIGGSAFAVLPMYIGEISSPKFRGFMGILFTLQHQAGVLFETILVPYVSITLNAQIALIIPTILVLIFIWMPESPYYFLMKNQQTNAGKSLKIFMQTNNIDQKLEFLDRVVQEEQNEVRNFTELFQVRNNRVSFILCLGVMSIQHLTGLVPVIVYGQITLEKSNSPIDSYVSGIIIQTVGLLVLFLGCLMVDSYGRRPLLLFSTFGTVIPFFLIAVYFHLDYIQYEYTSSLSLLPLIGLSLHQITALIGIVSITYVYISEVFSTNIKGFASLFVICYGSIVSSFCIKIFPDLCAILGIHNVYYLLICGCILSGIATYFFVPETKGKTLYEIQTILKKY